MHQNASLWRIRNARYRQVRATSRIKMREGIMSGNKEKWKLLPLQYLKVLDKKYCVEMFVLKVTKSEDEPEFNKIPIYYQEMI